MARRTVILGYARTPFGRLLGGLAGVPATQLGATAITAALERAGVEPGQVEHVIMGQVLQAGAGQIPSRQAAVAAGIPVEVPSETLNKVCASGHRAVTLGDLLVRVGEHDVIVAGGMESMSRAPHLLTDLRAGRKIGNDTLIDSMIHDGLTDPFLNVHMVVNGATVADELGISRERQDQWALHSHQRAAAARVALAEEIVPVFVPGRRGEIVVDVDESIRADTSIEQLAKLKPIMKIDGTTTAGNAPGVNDGAAVLVLASHEWAASAGHEPLAFMRGHACVAGESPYLAVWPGKAVQRLLARERLTIDEIDRIEVNEAFASVALNTIDMLGADPERVNVNGGAIALGHPVGASGARIIGTLVNELRRSGGGQGDALLVEVPAV